MFDAARDDQEFAFVDYCRAITELHAQSAFGHQEQLVFVFVMVPDELALQFYGFDEAIVDFTDDAGMAIIGKQRELFAKVDGVHQETSRAWTSLVTTASACCVVARVEVSE